MTYYLYYPYYWWWLPPYPLPDPMVAMYAWIYMWVGLVSTMYYLEVYKTMLDMLKKYVETMIKTS